uniref:Protein kinase domain-containing protein n=1 Tax=Thermosporothrix sp. COM3 TaxID=2490863 RepID=A0A455SLY8_9CHLR|nr:hypothetical protein KTC_41380 [Thermosporothrix sp. COM3]
MRAKTPHINRFAQIVRFYRVSRLLLWTIWVIYRERQRVIRARERGDYDAKPNSEVLIKVLEAFRDTAIQLGVLMIKLGQFLSSRADMLPEDALKVLADLQDEVPPAPFEHVVAVLETELGKPVEEIFSVLERKCTAAASLGQVHKAVLASTGETVAVKIQRPHIHQLVSMDLSTIRFVIWVVNRFVNPDFVDLVGLFREFRRTVFEEIDYVTEAANIKRFQEMFKDDPTISIPRVYDEYVSHHVLVIEWIDGIKLNDYAALEAAGFDRLEVANRTVRAYFYQFFEVGFFHADPHPGNIFVKKGSPVDDPVIALVDFGMVGTLTSYMKKTLRDLFIALVMRNAHDIVEALFKLGFIGKGANLTTLERGITILLDQYYGMTLGEVSNIDFSQLASDLESLLYGQPFQIPAQFAFSGRAVGTLVGVATGLAPEFNFFDVALPYARKFLQWDSKGIAQASQDLFREVLNTGKLLLTLPGSLERLISQIESGQVEVKVNNFTGNGKRKRRNGQITISEGSASSALTWLLVFGSSLGSGIYLHSLHQGLAGWFCFGLATLSVLGLLLRR